MPIINPDTSEAMDMSPIEPGTYSATVRQVDFKLSKEKKTPMIVPKFEVMVEGKPRSRNANLVISGPGSSGFDQLLRATGFVELADQYKDPNQPNPDFDTDSLIGIELQVRIDQELYEGEMRDNIKSFARA